jgi:signal transduction histidine kinase
MRSAVDLSSLPKAGFRLSKAWVWRWALVGGLAVAVLVIFSAPVWWFALTLLAWSLWGMVSFQRDAVQVMRQMVAANVNSAQPVVTEPAWHQWLSGWYWETNAAHRLCVFKPGCEMPQGLSIDWRQLNDFVQSQPAWLSLWSQASGELNESLAPHETRPATTPGAPASQPDAAPWQRLAYCLAQRQSWHGDLLLPWPVALHGLQAGAPNWRCALRGHVRFDAQGQFAGFQGVLLPVAPTQLEQGGVAGTSQPVSFANVAAPTATAAPTAAQKEAAAQAAQMSEAEQEALRYALSHDLRAPLRVVDGFTRIVKEDYGRVLDRLGQDHLERVLAASARMNGMIDAILAQGQLAGAPLQRSPVDLTAVAREVGGELLALWSGPTATLSVAEGLHIDADPALVRRVLENLIGNALKYSAKVASPRVEVGVMPATNPAVFFVRDNGAGFDMQHADKLFGMFQRLHSAKEFPGTGVGLAGVQNIVRRHGGRVWAEARQGEGACFYFTLMDAVMAQQVSARSD